MFHTQQIRLMVSDEVSDCLTYLCQQANKLPGFLTKLEEIGVKNCQNVYCKTIPAV